MRLKKGEARKERSDGMCGAPYQGPLPRKLPRGHSADDVCHIQLLRRTEQKIISSSMGERTERKLTCLIPSTSHFPSSELHSSHTPEAAAADHSAASQEAGFHTQGYVFIPTFSSYVPVSVNQAIQWEPKATPRKS